MARLEREPSSQVSGRKTHISKEVNKLVIHETSHFERYVAVKHSESMRETRLDNSCSKGMSNTTSTSPEYHSSHHGSQLVSACHLEIETVEKWLSEASYNSQDQKNMRVEAVRSVNVDDETKRVLQALEETEGEWAGNKLDASLNEQQDGFHWIGGWLEDIRWR